MKKVGAHCYYHRSCIDEIYCDSLIKAIFFCGDDFDYVKVNLIQESYTFVWCEGWDALPEPIVRRAVRMHFGLSLKGKIEERKYNSDNPPIIHGKHLFVRPDYKGFNMQEAKKRWDSYQGKPWLDKKRMGQYKWWQENAIPRFKLNNQAI